MQVLLDYATIRGIDTLSGVRVLASCSLALTVNSSVSWSGWLQLKVGSIAVDF